MTSRWRRRVGVLAAFVLFFELVLVLAGTGPRLVLVAGIVTTLAALGWMALDLGETVQPFPWPTRTAPSMATLGADARSRLLRTRLANVSAEGHTIRHLHDSLVDIIDDRLITDHLVDRFVDPDAAATRSSVQS